MSIIIDLILIGLLVGVILHSVRLGQSLEGFKKIHGEILPLMQEYTKSVQLGFKQIDNMKKISEDIDQTLNSRVPGALEMKGDLEFLIARSEELADHLEFMIRSGRSVEFSPLTQNTSQEKPVLKKEIAISKQQKNNLTSEKRNSKKTVKTPSETFFLTKTAKKFLGKD